MMEQRTRAPQSSLPPPANALLQPWKAHLAAVSAVDSMGSKTEYISTECDASDVITPTLMRAGKRGSLPGGAQTLREYQREQEELGADTTASKALFFLQNVDPQHVTTASVVPERGTDCRGGDAEGAVRQDRYTRALR
jgi:hypothetical protein